MSKTISMHFLVEGAFIQNLERQRFWYEDAEKHAIELLKEGFQGISDELVQKIIHGDAEITGWSVCDDPKCHQCKGLKGIQITEKPNLKFKKEIQKRIKWLNETHYKIGEFHISKKILDEYFDEFIRMESNFARNQDRVAEYEEEQILPALRRSIWNSYQFPFPSDRVIPKPNSRHYEFSIAVNDFLSYAEDLLQNEFRNNRPVLLKLEEIKDTISIVRQNIEYNEDEKGRIEGCTLLVIPNPEDDYKEIRINCPKEHLLNYYRVRTRSEHAIKFNVALEPHIEKEKLIKRIQNLEKGVGHAHTELMHSMNLRHSEFGVYDGKWLEFMVNEAIQAFILENMWVFDDEKKEQKPPNEIRLELTHGKACVNIYFDGKLVRENKDLR